MGEVLNFSQNQSQIETGRDKPRKAYNPRLDPEGFNQRQENRNKEIVHKLLDHINDLKEKVINFETLDQEDQDTVISELNVLNNPGGLERKAEEIMGFQMSVFDIATDDDRSAIFQLKKEILTLAQEKSII